MKAIYDYFITQLNDNDSELVYQGNYVFMFNQDKMTLYQEVTGTLVNKEVEFSPVSIISKTPVTFIEKNKRIDWSLELGIAIRIQGQQYDSDNDLDYDNIMRVINAMQGGHYTLNSSEYSVKLDAEPSYQGFVQLGNSKYALLTLNMLVTEMSSGYFGQDWTVTIDGAELDILSFSPTMTKRYLTSDKKNELTNDYNKPVGRTMVFEVVFNYKNETDILSEVMGKAPLQDDYALVATLGETDYSYTVSVQSGTPTIVNGAVVKMTVRFVEVL